MLQPVFIISFFLIGLYDEWTAALAGIAISVIMLLQKGSLRKISWGWAEIGVGLWFAAHLLSPIWAIDSGMAALGIVKVLPIPLFAVAISSLPAEERQQWLELLPGVGALMTVLSLVLMWIPALKSSLVVAGRLAGFFEYPNTFATFLLIGLSILIMEADGGKSILKPVQAILLAAGIILAGSRSIYLMSIPTLVASIVLSRSWKRKWWLLAATAGGLAAGFLAGNLLQMVSAERVSSISLGASTWLGRLLYWKDAIPVIIKHPLGLGYLGYYFSQGSFQSGLYSVRWILNAFLQWLLDVGWLPSLAMLAAAIYAVLSRRTSPIQKMVMIIVLAHSMVDFDLEFTSFWFLLLLCMDWKERKEGRHESWMILFPCISIIACLYFGSAAMLQTIGHDEACLKIYPWHTIAMENRLMQTSSPSEMDDLSDRILRQNSYVALAWDGKAQVAFSEGDFGAVIGFKRKALDNQPYQITEYQDYFEKLKIGTQLYLQMGDTDSAVVCENEIISLQQRLSLVEERTDPLAFRIKDQPTLEMGKDYYEYINFIDQRRGGGK